MKKTLLVLAFAILFTAFMSAAYSADSKHEHSYKAHFSDMDLDGDDQINWKEFKTFFKHAEKEIFKKADSNTDNFIDHDEWHDFKAAQGYTHE